MIDNIPVVANGDFEKLIGRAKLDENENLVITISKDQLLREMAYLITLDQIRCLTVGVGYVAATPLYPEGSKE